MATGDRVATYAEISAQGISIDFPKFKLDGVINDGDVLKLGSLSLEVWNTPGHTAGQLAFRLGDLLFSGDNMYRDGCVGNIDAHHGSDIPAFIKSLTRIRNSNVKWLLPSHGPIFKKGQRALGPGDRQAGNVSAHGRLRHVCRRLAVARYLGRGVGCRFRPQPRLNRPGAYPRAN